MANLPERFLDKISPEPNTGCWLWTAALASQGYGHFTVVSGKQAKAHRYAFEIMRGPVPAGMELDHLCRVRSCVNPDHLRVVTHAENMRVAFSANAHKRECKRGHAFSGGNTYSFKGHRRCKTCALEMQKIRRRKENPDGEGRITRLS